MKTFEERYTAWIDGALTDEEQAAFAAELAEQGPDAEADRHSARQLGTLLRKHGVAPALTSPDFFNAQLLEQIAREERAAARAAEVPTRRWSFSWALPHLAWGGVCCLLLSFTVYREWVAPTRLSGYPTLAAARVPVPATNAVATSTSSGGGYDASVLEAHAVDPGISATPVQSTTKDGVTVLWLDGLDYLPASYDLH